MYFTISPTATAQPDTTATSSCMTTNRGTIIQHAQYNNKQNITTSTILQQAQYYQVPIQQKQQYE